MTDRPGSEESTDHPETSEVAEVRRLLRQARVVDPMPEEVEARMRQVLTRLGDETPAASDPRPATVVPISAHRRRNAAGLLLAAAAVVVGGIVVAPHLHVTSHGPGGSAASAGGPSSEFDSGADHGSNQGSSQSAPKAGRTRRPAPQVRGGRLVVRPRHFAADAGSGLRLLRRPAALRTQAAPVCAGVPRRATSVPAEYQQAPAALVYGPVRGSTRVVDLYVCGNARPVRSATLSLP